MEQDVSAYYDQTQNHYRRWWDLDNGMSLHYGLWNSDTLSFKEALINTNKYMADLAGISENTRVLDAGCGVGGAAIYLAKEFHARTNGLSLSKLQVTTARENAERHQVNKLVEFHEEDFTKTGFEDETFDTIWACESSSSAPNKDGMLGEWYRLLKPGGKLILLDFFKSSDAPDYGNLLDKWSDLWAMSRLVSVEKFQQALTRNNFRIIIEDNLTPKVVPTIKRMYRSYLLGIIPSITYNLLFGASKYSKNHYKSGLYQYKAYREGLWQYRVFLAEKCDLQQSNM